MLTPDELAALPIFSTLSPVALADVARGAADIRLNAGEYAVYEGEPPALFVVIEGAIEVIKLVDGIERKIGMRLPGKLFGEVPLVFGTQFQAGFRASEPTRVVKLDARPYYDLAASSPELVKTMDELARERIGGLQKIAAEPRSAQVLLLGNRWDSACLDLRRFLERNQISFSWLTLDDPNLADHWPGPPPDSDCPALRLAGRRDAHQAAAARVRGAAWPSDRSALSRNTIRSSLAGDRRASPPLSTEPPRGCARSWSNRKRREARRRRRRESRTILGFRAGSRARSSRAGRFDKPNGLARRFSSRARLFASILTPAVSSSTTTKSCKRGPSLSRPG